MMVFSVRATTIVNGSFESPSGFSYKSTPSWSSDDHPTHHNAWGTLAQGQFGAPKARAGNQWAFISGDGSKDPVSIWTIVGVVKENKEYSIGFLAGKCDTDEYKPDHHFEVGIWAGDSVAHNVTWKKSSDLSSLRSSPVKIHFVMNDAKLYSFAFRSDDVDEGAMSSSKTDWFQKAKWGIMVHYLADPLAASGGGKGKDFVLEPRDWNKQIDSFDVKALADQLEEIGVGYCLITIGQNSGHYCSPNATYDRIVGITPGKCSRRDLVADLAGELEHRGIRLMVYLPSGAPAADPVAAEKLKWRWGFAKDWPGGWGGQRTDERLVQFQRNWEAVIREWSLRWGKHLAGWWIDGCYFADEMYRFDDPPNFVSFAAALRAGNSDAIIAFNPGVRNPIAAHTEHEDYTAGEISGEIPVCSGRWVEHKGKKIQYHVLSYMGKGWGTGDKPRYGTEQLIEHTRRVTDGGGVITWDVPFEKNGRVAPGFVEPLKALGRAIKKTMSD